MSMDDSDTKDNQGRRHERGRWRKRKAKWAREIKKRDTPVVEVQNRRSRPFKP